MPMNRSRGRALHRLRRRATEPVKADVVDARVADQRAVAAWSQVQELEHAVAAGPRPRRPRRSARRTSGVCGAVLEDHGVAREQRRHHGVHRGEHG